MVDIKFYLVTVDRFDYRVISELSEEEKQRIICYAVNPSKPKMITSKVKTIKEWELKWYTPRYQYLMYYEYGLLPHCLNNPELINGLTHIGMMHYDSKFPKDSVHSIIDYLEEHPQTIYYKDIRKSDVWYLTKDQFKYICEFMSEKMNMNIEPEKAWENGFISESFAIMPIDIFKKFAEFMYKYQYEFEKWLNTNQWGLMNQVKHRLCGIVERLYGIYLVSCNLELKEMPILHEREFYTHAHLKEK